MLKEHIDDEQGLRTEEARRAVLRHLSTEPMIERRGSSTSSQRSGGPSLRRLALHAAALMLVLIGAALVTGPGTGVTSDEGAAAYQAVLLSRSGWILPPTLPELDPLGARQPFLRADEGARGRAPYAKHPLYPVVLSLAGRVAPVGGLVAVSVVGTWVASIFAGLLAEATRARAGPVALWLVGAMSPLAVDATWVLAHAPAAAAGAATIFAAERFLGGSTRGGPRSLGWLGLSCLAAGLTVGLRTEGAILVAALSLGLVVCRRPGRRSLLAAGAVLLGGAAGRLVEVVVLRRTVGSGVAVPDTPSSQLSFLAARREAFLSSWVEPGGGAGRYLLIAAGLLAVAAVAYRRRFPVAVVAAIATLAAALAGAWFVAGPMPVPGLIPATAWLGAGLIVVGGRALAPGLPRLLAVTTSAAALGILAIQYSFGGGVEWGGRFYAILLPGAAALVAGTWPEGRRPGSTVLPVALAVVAAVTSVGGVLTVRDEHERTSGLERDILAAGAVAGPGRPGDADPRPVVLSNRRLWPQLVWRSFDDLRWVSVEPPDTACALADLRRAGFRRIVVTENPLLPFVEEAGKSGWQVDPASPTSGFARVLADADAPPGPGPGCPPS